MRFRSVLILLLVLGVTIALGPRPASAGPLTLHYTVTVTTYCQPFSNCVAFDATFPLTVSFDDQPTDTQIYDTGAPDFNLWYITRYFGAPTMSPTPLPILANPYGAEDDFSWSMARYQAEGSIGGSRTGNLHAGRVAHGGPAEQWSAATELFSNYVPAAFAPWSPDMPTAESLSALLGGTVDFYQYGSLLNEDRPGEGYYWGTATLVPEPASLLLFATGLVGAWRRFKAR
jgi:hypothetical protein